MAYRLTNISKSINLIFGRGIPKIYPGETVEVSYLLPTMKSLERDGVLKIEDEKGKSITFDATRPRTSSRKLAAGEFIVEQPVDKPRQKITPIKETPKEETTEAKVTVNGEPLVTETIQNGETIKIKRIKKDK